MLAAALACVCPCPALPYCRCPRRLLPTHLLSPPSRRLPQVTTPDDMSVAERFLEEAALAARPAPTPDPLEEARVQDCEEDPSTPECRVYDD
jgi:hypothetical protein